MNSLENILSELYKWLMLTEKKYNSIKSYGFIIRQGRVVIVCWGGKFIKIQKTTKQMEIIYSNPNENPFKKNPFFFMSLLTFWAILLRAFDYHWINLNRQQDNEEKRNPLFFSTHIF